MTETKPILVLWSKAAVAAAGPRLTALQAELVSEASDIVSEARDWFLHALAGEDADDCFVAFGHETPDAWTVFVKRGVYQRSKPLARDPSDPEQRETGYRLPRAVDEADNEVFARFEELPD
jgi:hypothetical protein